MLSVDNAVVLAAQTEQLKVESERKKALMYGMGGAYLFRFIAIGLGTYLLQFWPIKAVGALYLVWMSGSYFYAVRHPKAIRPLTSTKRMVYGNHLQIESLDIVFSVDSILAALAVSPNPVIVLIGGCLGILAMRIVAQVITTFIDRVPELETAAYVLVGLIAIKLGLSLPMIHVETPDWLFSVLVVVIFIWAGWRHAVHARHHH
ncbi:membrane protein, partial [Lacticaseibacillus rhamnosus]